MNVLFNTFGQAEELGLTLCLPSSKATEKDGAIYLSNTVGAIPNASSLSSNFPFNSYAEMSFSVDRSTCPITVFDRIEMGMYVFAEGIGYFVIKENKEERDYLGNVQTKSVSLASCEYELYDSEAPAFEDGLYQIHGVINQCAELAPRWRFSTANISPSLFAKERRFTDVETENMYDFLITDTQDSFECVVEFDRIFREVKLIDREDYFTAHETDIHLSRANVIDKLIKESSSDDFYTGIRVSGEGDLSIRIVNPTGEEVIYNFDYRLPWMSPALQEALAKWKNRVAQEKDAYHRLSLQWVEANDALTLWESRLTGEREEVAAIEQAIANYAQLLAEATADEKKTIQQLMDDAQEQRLTLQSVCSQTEDEVSEARYHLEQLDAQMRAVNEACKLGTSSKDMDGNHIFTDELLEELSAYISVGEYTDEYMAQTESMSAEEKLDMAAELMARAESQLVKIASDNYKFTVENRDFLFDQKFQIISQKLVPGAIIWVETDDDTVEQFHLSNIDISYEEHTCSLTFSNKYNKYDLQSLFDDVFGTVKKNASSLKYLTDIIVGQTEKIERYGDWIDAAMTLTATHALQSDTQEVRIDNIGYWGRRLLEVDQNGFQLYAPEQIRIMSNGVYLTDDNWNTVKSAIGKIVVGENDDGTPIYKYGVVGDVLIGKIIAGTNLTIQSEGDDGIVNTVLDQNGVSVYNGDLTVYANQWGAETQSKVLYFDHDTNVLTVSGKIIAQTGSIGGLTISNSKLYGVTGYKDNLTDGSSVSYISGFNNRFHYASGNTIFLWAGAQVSNTGNSAISNIFGADTWTDAKTIIENTSSFYVTHEGALYATGVDIKGKIQANSGTIGGWDVSSNVLRHKFYDIDNNVTREIYLQTYKGASSLAMCIRSVAGDYTTESTESWNYHFSVRNNGQLNASNAVIEGKITATSGTIGGCEIVGGKLTIKSANISDLTVDKIGAGTNSKAVKFTNITATGGKIGGWTISDGRLEGTYSHSIGAGEVFQGTLSITPEIVEFEDEGSGSASDYTGWVYIIKSANNFATTYTGESDVNVKNSIEEYSAQYEALFDGLRPCRYKYNHGTSDRYHTGFIAQDVVLAIETAGLTTQDFAGVIHLEKPTVNGSEWLLRRDEFVSLNTWQIQKSKARIAALEARVEQLEDILANR